MVEHIRFPPASGDLNDEMSEAVSEDIQLEWSRSSGEPINMHTFKNAMLKGDTCEPHLYSARNRERLSKGLPFFECEERRSVGVHMIPNNGFQETKGSQSRYVRTMQDSLRSTDDHFLCDGLGFLFQLTHPTRITTVADYLRFWIKFIMSPGLDASIDRFACKSIESLAERLSSPRAP